MEQSNSLDRKETMIVAIGMFSFLIGLIHPLAWVVSIVLMGMYWEIFEKSANQESSPKIWIWLSSIAVIISILGFGVQVFAPDDLLRSVVAHRFEYDYSRIFGDAPLLPSFNLWIGFEMAAGKLEQMVGAEIAVRIIVMVIFSAFMISLSLAIAKLVKENPDRWLIVTAIIVATFMSTTGWRALIGRPEILFTAVLFAAVWMKPKIWVLTAIVMTPLYWLSPIYACGALLLNTSWTRKVLYGALVASSGLCFWFYYSDGMIFHALSLVPQWEEARIMQVGELRPIVGNISSMPFITMIGAILYLMVKRKSVNVPYALPLVIVLSIYLVPNYARYIGTVGGLIAILLAAYIGKEKISMSGHTKYLVCMLVVFLAFKTAAGKGSETKKMGPEFDIPENAYVLSEFNEGLYNSIMQNPHARFAPSYEFGANTNEVQTILKNYFKEGEFDCEAVKKHKFTHFQERELKHMPECLELDQIYRAWRLWKVKYD